MMSGFVRATVYVSSQASKSALKDPNYISVSCRQFHKYVTLYARKPMWLPIAKSKLYKVPEKPVLPVDEFEEIEYHTKNYETLMNSLVELQKSKDKEATTKYNIKMKTTDEEIVEMFAKNEAANKLVADQREEAYKLEWPVKEKEILEKKALKESLKREKTLAQEQYIKSQMERLETAVRLEDLDEVIDKALSNVTDYNYAIDLKGNYYKGRYTTPQVNK